LLYFINCLISWFDSKRCCVVSSIPSFPRIRSNRTLVLLVLILAVNVLKKFGFIFMNIFYKKNLIIKKNNLVLNSLTVNLDLITKFLPTVNFINVIRTNFSYKSLFLAAFLVKFWLWQTYKSTFVRKICAFKVDEIDT